MVPGLALILFLSGAAWWVSAAPQSTRPASGATGPSVGTTGLSSAAHGRWVWVSREPPRADVLPPVPGTAPARTDPGPHGPVVPGYGPGAAGASPTPPASTPSHGPYGITGGPGAPARVERALPRFADTVLRQAVVLTDSRPRSWSMAAVTGGRYLLQFVCYGPGAVRLRVRAPVPGTGPDRPYGPAAEEQEASCDGVVGDVGFTAPTDRLSVSVAPTGSTPVQAALQLIALP